MAHASQARGYSQPENIATDISDNDAFSDGLTVGMHDKLVEALGSDNAAKTNHSR